ncbi:hypothetical protein GQ457_01G019260 [Hibiscus cannabinus]
MPFGLCNAPANFQRCMLAIFSDMVEEFLEVFMDDFSVLGETFDSCLGNLAKVLKRCEEADLVLNWEKCHFMVNEGTVLGHKISSKGIEVDKAKVEVIEKLPPPTNVKGIRSFLGHADFYRRFIKDFSKISKPLCNLLQQNQPFVFDKECQSAFEELKMKLISAPVVVPPDWSSPFELMCDASDHAVGAALGQRRGKLFHVIYYASRTLNEAQINYTTTEKELLAVVFAFEKFRSYLIGTKVIVHTDHSARKYLVTKKDAKPRLIRWILLLQEFDLEVKDRKGTENQVANHLSRLDNPHNQDRDVEISDSFPDEKILFATAIPWYADIVNFLVSGIVPPDLSSQGRKKFRHDAKFFYWDEPYLFKQSMMHNKVPAKKIDHESFIIPCSIEHNYSTKALCDSGASINLMPKSVFQKLGIGETKPTTMMLQLADYSFVQLERKIEDILVRVDKFTFPTDFLILDSEANEHAPIILGRPFLATSRVMINFKKGELALRVDREQVKIKVFTVSGQHKNEEECKASHALVEKCTQKLKPYMGAHTERDKTTMFLRDA